ncbi:Peptidyl-prolyl isomerase cwc27 [Linnemannia gamsii]|uniref:Peptidyl-prolyl isomerase cwc27 n=1 Tax=Linnemannia gamsii TaxID=64522 RepID=A0ABQ7KAZ3_9FUNG|nr:Peptidyl-prolyl isomerase cwc27 [Linnemannia gamsii]
MSNIYLLEPHTNGKVILHTTYGDISIELWPKEAPKACRNFVQLCMEGYYNDTIFHRIVANFIVQGGDPEGTGLGGESIYEGGEPFVDEFHSRLRFVRRGLVAMANSGAPNDNRSQFFITLDTTMELQNKHTIFGKIAGDTIFNVLKIGGLEVDTDERPLYPPKVTSCTIVVNPFDDIIPRLSRQEKEALRLKELEAQKRPEKQKKLKKNVALLSFADDAPDMTMDDDSNKSNDSKRKKKMLSSHDLLEDDPTLSRDTDHKLVSEIRDGSSSSKRKASNEDNAEEGQDGMDVDDTNESLNAYDQRMRDQVREKLKRAKLAKESTSSTSSANVNSKTESSSRAPSKPDTPSTAPKSHQPASAVAEPVLSAGDRVRQEIQKLEGDIRKMHNRDSDREAAEAAKKKGKGSKVSLLQLEREQYKTRAESKGGDSRKKSRAASNAEKERELLDKLSVFETKVFAMAREPEPNPAPKKNDAPPCEIHGIPSCESCQDNTASKKKKQLELAHSDDEPVVEDDSDDDIGWMQHKLVFEKDLKGKDVSLASKRDDANEYIVIDPLNKADSTTAALAVEKQRNLEKFKRTNQQQDSGRDRKPYGDSSRGGGGGVGSYDRSSKDSSLSYLRRGDQSRQGYNRDSLENRDNRDSRGKGYRDNRDSRDSRDNRDRRDHRDSRDSRDSRDRRDRR